jgi:hypothetical protein
MRHSHLRYGPSRIDVNTRRDADVKCINRNRAGERERLSRIDITKLLPGSIMRRGIDISLNDFFL